MGIIVTNFKKIENWSKIATSRVQTQQNCKVLKNQLNYVLYTRVGAHFMIPGLELTVTVIRILWELTTKLFSNYNPIMIVNNYQYYTIQ